MKGDTKELNIPEKSTAYGKGTVTYEFNNEYSRETRFGINVFIIYYEIIFFSYNYNYYNFIVE